MWFLLRCVAIYTQICYFIYFIFKDATIHTLICIRTIRVSRIWEIFQYFQKIKCMTTLKEKQLINDFHLHSFVVNNIYRLFAITYPMHVIDKMGYLLFTTPIHIWGTSHPTEHMTDVQNDKIEYEHSAWCTMLEECI
jgi:hypothetical protein